MNNLVFTYDLNNVTVGAGLMDIEFDGIDQSGPSYEARVFLNNADANHDTAKLAEYGYAGSFFVFGFGGCLGDEGHCEWKPGEREFDARPNHKKTGSAVFSLPPEMLERCKNSDNKLVVTVVPVIRENASEGQRVNSLHTNILRNPVAKSSALLLRKPGQTRLKDATRIESTVRNES
ncbi:MAG: hypothetical protein EKK48_29710 [Candidatus Melainabacteria bacterium]|jgi:hypothetical protein|nr:MAG: hypothetical protein EKK48_29710 [Candidatus Melainabacteria bacterium]